MVKKLNDKSNKVEEPQANYPSLSRTIRVFSSIEAMSETEAQERAQLTYKQRLNYAEALRKRIFNKYLNADGSWIPMKKSITINNFQNEIGG